MLRKKWSKIVTGVLLMGALVANAQELPSAFSPIQNVDLKGSQANSTNEIDVNFRQFGSAFTAINLSNPEETFDIATDKFVQGNARAAWNDFKELIKNIPTNEFAYLMMANKMSNFGMFDLANLAQTKMKDRDLTNVSVDAMKRFYYPRRVLKLDDELFLAEIFSNISFNNRSSEATNELLEKDSLLGNSDYANYLVALGYYKSGNYSKAAKYINIAILQNPNTLNYQKLKAEILAELGDSYNALKVVESLKQQNLIAYEYECKVKSLEQFVLYKVSKSQWEKDYHLGYYYYLENDSSKAIRTLQDATAKKKRANLSMVYGLMSQVYLSMKEFEKAADTAQKAHKHNSNNPQALMTLGDLCYQKNDYKKALSYYKQAASEDKKSYEPYVKVAKTYQKLNNTKKATEIYTKILKTHSDSWEAYYNIALIEKDKRETYVKKSLAVNPRFSDGWVELAKLQIDNGEYSIAQKYLKNAYKIDENNFRYYYYQGIVDKNLGDSTQAIYNFKKCLRLNHNFTEAKEALDKLTNNNQGL